MAADRQHIEPGDQRTIGALLRRIEAARRFPDNTDPSVRHVQIMGETLGAGLPYPMLDEERGHCATSLLAVVAGLYEARNAKLQGLDAVVADAEKLCWALRQFVRMVPAGEKLCWVRFKVGVQEFTIGSEPMPEDEAAQFAGLFVFALAGAFRTLPNGAQEASHG